MLVGDFRRNQGIRSSYWCIPKSGLFKRDAVLRKTVENGIARIDSGLESAIRRSIQCDFSVNRRRVGRKMSSLDAIMLVQNLDVRLLYTRTLCLTVGSSYNTATAATEKKFSCWWMAISWLGVMWRHQFRWKLWLVFAVTSQDSLPPLRENGTRLLHAASCTALTSHACWMSLALVYSLVQLS
jgi:hypothetical protein